MAASVGNSPSKLGDRACYDRVQRKDNFSFLFARSEASLLANHVNTPWAKTVFTRSAITPTKVDDLDDIGSTVSTLLRASPGRFWARFAQ